MRSYLRPPWTDFPPNLDCFSSFFPPTCSANIWYSKMLKCKKVFCDVITSVLYMNVKMVAAALVCHRGQRVIQFPIKSFLVRIMYTSWILIFGTNSNPNMQWTCDQVNKEGKQGYHLKINSSFSSRYIAFSEKVECTSEFNGSLYSSIVYSYF